MAAGSWPARRYDGFYYMDCAGTNPRRAATDAGRFDVCDVDALADLVALLRRGKKPVDHIFHGSQWWAITRDAAQYVIETDRSDKHLRDSFKFSGLERKSATLAMQEGERRSRKTIASGVQE